MKEGLDPKSKLELANLLIQIGFREEAVAELLTVASILRESGETEEAITVYKRVLDLEPENWAAIRGLEELAPGPPTRRVEEIVSRMGLEEIKPSITPAPAEDRNQTWRDFKERISELEDDPEKRLVLGERFLESGMVLEAQTQLEAAYQLKRSPRAIELLATCLIKKGDYPGAMSLLKEGINSQFSPNEKLGFHYLLGTIYQSIDDVTKALEEFSKIVKISPDYRDTQELIALLRGAVPTEPVIEERFPVIEAEPELERLPEPGEEKIAFL